MAENEARGLLIVIPELAAVTRCAANKSGNNKHVSVLFPDLPVFVDFFGEKQVFGVAAGNGSPRGVSVSDGFAK